MLHWAPILLWWFLSDCSQDTRKQRLRYPPLNFHNYLPFLPLPPLFTSAGNDWANDDFPSMYCTSKTLAEWGLCTISPLTILSEIWNTVLFSSVTEPEPFTSTTIRQGTHLQMKRLRNMTLEKTRTFLFLWETYFFLPQCSYGNHIHSRIFGSKAQMYYWMHRNVSVPLWHDW